MAIPKVVSKRKLAIRMGFWSSIAILVSGLGLLGGILASSILLPTTLTTEWNGIESYADAYRATGGTITSLSFLAALISCPAYVSQIWSIHVLDSRAGRKRAQFGLALAVIFSALAGVNYVVQLTIVRIGILKQQTEGLAWLVFQNPGSFMLAIDFIGWFFLGLAFLSVVPCFRSGRLSRMIRYVLVLNAAVGIGPLVGLAVGDASIGLIFLTTTSALLTIVDILLLVFFRKLLGTI